MSWLKHCKSLLITGLLICLGTGCDQLPDAVQEQVKKAQNQVQSIQEGATELVEKVKEKTTGAGSADLVVGTPAVTARCYASLVKPGAARPAIFQLQTYRTAGDESFPSMFFHSTATVDSLPALAGQELSGVMFVQLVEGGPVWTSAAEQPVKIRILSSDGSTLEAEIVQASLTSTKGEALPAVTGKFHAVVP